MLRLLDKAGDELALDTRTDRAVLEVHQGEDVAMHELDVDGATALAAALTRWIDAQEAKAAE